jgi:hypothetical protein
MAFSSLGSFASTVDKVSRSSFSFPLGAPLNAGELGVLVIACDNLDPNDGDFGVVTGVTDSAGNVWQKAGEFTNGQGGAGAGATVAIWYTVAAATLLVTDFITITFRAALTAKAVIGHRFAKSPDTIVKLAATAGRADDGVDPGPVSLTGLASREYLFIRGIATESATTTSLTATSGWTAIIQAVTSGGGSATNIGARGEQLIATRTSVTSDPTLFAADHASVLVALYEETASVFQGSASLSGIGAQSAAGLLLFTASASQLGLGQLTGAGLYVATAQAAPLGLGHLTGSAIAVAQAQGELAGTGNLGAAGTPVAQGSANLGGQGSLGVSFALQGAALLEGLGSLGATAQAVAVAEARLTGGGTLAASAIPIAMAGAALAGQGSASATAVLVLRAEGLLPGLGDAQATGSATGAVGSLLTGHGSMQATGLLVLPARAGLVGDGSMHAVGLLVFTTSGGLVGDGDMHATGLLVLPASGNLTGQGAMGTRGLLVLAANGSFSGQGALQGAGLLVLTANGILAGQSDMQAMALLISIAAGMLGGHGRLLVIPFAEAYRRLDGVAALREPALAARYSRIREGKATYRAWR